MKAFFAIEMLRVFYIPEIIIEVYMIKWSWDFVVCFKYQNLTFIKIISILIDCGKNWLKQYKVLQIR